MSFGSRTAGGARSFRAGRGYRGRRRCTLRLPLPRLSAPPKLVLFSPLMSYLGIGGIFIPACEAQRERHLPDWEISVHLRPRAGAPARVRQREEANYVGYLACRAHPDRDFQYSGTFRAGALRAERARPGGPGGLRTGCAAA